MLAIWNNTLHHFITKNFFLILERMRHILHSLTLRNKSHTYVASGVLFFLWWVAYFGINACVIFRSQVMLSLKLISPVPLLVSPDGPVIWRMLTYPPTRRALLVGCGLQMFQQLSGINTVMWVKPATILPQSSSRGPNYSIDWAVTTDFLKLYRTCSRQRKIVHSHNYIFSRLLMCLQYLKSIFESATCGVTRAN